MKASDEKYVDLVYRLISRMSKIEKIDLTQDEHLFNSLLYHIPAMILRLKRGIHIKILYWRIFVTNILSFSVLFGMH